MCIAIVVPENKILSDEHFKNSYEGNKDGCGIAFVNNYGVICVVKSLNFDRFKKIHDRVNTLYSDRVRFVHFRIKTHGSVSIENCHPFVIDKDNVMMHNGTITPCLPAKTETRDISDTRLFVESILQKLPPNWMDNEAVSEMIEHYIGYSKVAVLSSDESYIIYNEGKGTWDDGIWYSNDRYKTVTKGRGFEIWQGTDSKSQYGEEYPTSNGMRARWDRWFKCMERFNIVTGKWQEWDSETNSFKSEPDYQQYYYGNLVKFPAKKEEPQHFDKCEYCFVEFSTLLNRVQEYTDTALGGTITLCDFCVTSATKAGLSLTPLVPMEYIGGD